MKAKQMVKVKTVDLKPGDVVVHGDLRQKVMSIELPKHGCLVRVNNYRNWFMAGERSIQDVEREVDE